ncbi:head decoration protein [Methylobacterium indicum]|uniref:Head decoration protein n=1 Tax=Methylobacterium indicum TaxID=1775910 RepID=A0A8H8WSD8_9HYPH|nr:head decoration protein [Methylobacterium indicum]BCM83588.1 hypothetical protein mvi_20490 [Methylobacterium indicum]
MPYPKSSTVDWDNSDYRFASPYPHMEGVVPLSAGQNLKEGSVLGKVTATGEYVLSCRTKENGDLVTDGSEKPSVVLLRDCDATDGDKQPAVYLTGHFLTTFLKLGRGHTFPSVKDALRANNIFYGFPVT